MSANRDSVPIYPVNEKSGGCHPALRVHHSSKETRTPAAMAKGANNSPPVTPAPSNASATAGSPPCKASFSARVPMIRTGTYRGKIRSANRIPPRWTPTVNAAPTAPSSNMITVPISRLATKTGATSSGRPNISPNMGDYTGPQLL